MCCYTCLFVCLCLDSELTKVMFSFCILWSPPFFPTLCLRFTLPPSSLSQTLVAGGYASSDAAEVLAKAPISGSPWTGINHLRDMSCLLFFSGQHFCPSAIFHFNQTPNRIKQSAWFFLSWFSLCTQPLDSALVWFSCAPSVAWVIAALWYGLKGWSYSVKALWKLFPFWHQNLSAHQQQTQT